MPRVALALRRAAALAKSARIVSLERERAARDLRAAVGQDEAELILSSIRRLVAKAERDPVLLALLVRTMDGGHASEA